MNQGMNQGMIPMMAYVNNEANILINRLGNVGLNDVANNLNNINTINNVKSNKTNFKEFGQYKDHRNVITTLIPSNNLYANFDNKTYPNEKYMATFLNGKTEELQASDINDYALEVNKVMYNHNKSIKQADIKGYAYNYVRTSDVNGTSIKTQTDACIDFAKQNGYIILGYYCDNGYSGRQGKNLKRGELGFWTQYFKENTNLIVYSVDRLTRHLVSGIQYLDLLASRNIHTHFVTNKIIYNSQISSMNRSMVQQELQTAEKYSNDTSEKIKGTLRRLKNDGHCIGGRIPYGVKRIVINGIRKQVPNPIEADNIKMIKAKYYDIWKNFDMYNQYIIRRTHANIVRYITKWCEEQNIKYRNNKTLNESQINTMITKKQK